MTKRSIAMLALLALSLATIGVWKLSNSMPVQAFESSNPSTSPEQTSAPGAKPVTWEYKVLASNVESVMNFRAYPTTRSQFPGANLEEDINKLSAQGYVVESIQMSSSSASVQDTGSGPASISQPIVVLLRRMRK